MTLGSVAALASLCALIKELLELESSPLSKCLSPLSLHQAKGAWKRHYLPLLVPMHWDPSSGAIVAPLEDRSMASSLLFIRRVNP